MWPRACASAPLLRPLEILSPLGRRYAQMSREKKKSGVSCSCCARLHRAWRGGPFAPTCVCATPQPHPASPLRTSPILDGTSQGLSCSALLAGWSVNSWCNTTYPPELTPAPRGSAVSEVGHLASATGVPAEERTDGREDDDQRHHDRDRIPCVRASTALLQESPEPAHDRPQSDRSRWSTTTQR